MDPEKKKPLAALIVANLGKKKPMPESDMPNTEGSEVEEEGESDDYGIMASEILDAIESKDPAGLATALKSFVSSCGGA